MSDMKCSSKMKKDETQDIYVPLEKGPSHIIQCLIGIYGTNASDVLNTITKQWISQNMDMLERYGIEIKTTGGIQALDKHGD